MSNSFYELGLVQEAAAANQEGRELFPEDAELLYQHGITLLNEGNYEEAREAFMKVLNVETSHYFSSFDRGILSFKSYRLIGTCLNNSGNYIGAKTWWNKALEAAPQMLNAAHEYFRAALAAGDLVSARAMVDHLRKYSGPSEFWTTAASEYAATVGGVRNALAFFQAILNSEPHLNFVRISYARFLATQGMNSEAIEQYQHLNSLGNAEAAFALSSYASASGDSVTALNMMRRAHELNPLHEETIRRLHELEEIT